jgi:hypothetical protein
MKQACATADRRRSVLSPDAQHVVVSDQYAVTGCESVTFAPITGNDSGDDGFSACKEIERSITNKEAFRKRHGLRPSPTTMSNTAKHAFQ